MVKKLINFQYPIYNDIKREDFMKLLQDIENRFLPYNYYLHANTSKDKLMKMVYGSTNTIDIIKEKKFKFNDIQVKVRQSKLMNFLLDIEVEGIDEKIHVGLLKKSYEYNGHYMNLYVSSLKTVEDAKVVQDYRIKKLSINLELPVLIHPKKKMEYKYANFLYSYFSEDDFKFLYYGFLAEFFTSYDVFNIKNLMYFDNKEIEVDSIKYYNICTIHYILSSDKEAFLKNKQVQIYTYEGSKMNLVKILNVNLNHMLDYIKKTNYFESKNNIETNSI